MSPSPSRLAAVFALLALGACAAAPAPAPATMRALDAEEEPATLDEAEARLSRARAALDGTSLQALGNGSNAPMGAGATAQAEPSQPTPQSPPPPASQTIPAEKKPEAERRPDDACATTCRAFGSMKRAVAAICRIAGDADRRCTDAKATLESYAPRVRATCGCGGE